MAELTDTTVNGETVYHSGNDGSGSGLDADTVDGHHADEMLDDGSGGQPGVVVVNSYSGADPSGSSTSDSAFSSAVSDANDHDIVLFYGGTFLLESYHDISKPLTIKCQGATLRTTATASSGNERPQIRFMGDGVQAQTGLSNSISPGSEVIPVADSSIFSAGDRVLIMGESYSYGVDTPSEFFTIQSVSSGQITLNGSTDQGFGSSSGTAHRVSLIEGAEFVDVTTEGGGDTPLGFRWCENPRYDECKITKYLQMPLAAVDCFKPKWYNCEVSDPVGRGSGEGEAICLYRTTDAYVESPRIYNCRRGIDLAWGCQNTTIIDPVIKSYSIAGISVHSDDIGGSVRIKSGQLIADPNGTTGNGITGSPNRTSLSIEQIDIITRRAAILANCPTTISDVHISPSETVSSGAGIQIRNGPVKGDGVIIDDPESKLNQPVDIRSDDRTVKNIDIDAYIEYHGSNAVYLEATSNPIEDVDLSGTIQSSDQAGGQCVFFYSSGSAFDNIDFSMDILNHAEYGIRFDGGVKNGELRIHDAKIDSEYAGVPILDYSSWGGANKIWIKDCTLLYDSDGHSDSVHLGSGTVDYAWVRDNYAPGSIMTTAVQNLVDKGNMPV